MFKISPSDFAYLFHDCKHCFYRKYKYGIVLPSIPSPGVFSKLNSLIEADLIGMNLRSITPNAPDAIIRKTEGFVRSKPVPNRMDCYVSGRFDALAETDDHSFVIIDFKITDASAEKAEKYSTQLMAYQFALENPAAGDPVHVSRLAIMAITPESLKYSRNGIQIIAQAYWFSPNAKLIQFYSFMDEISLLLAGPEPSPSSDCPYCSYRIKYQVFKTEQRQPDVAFIE